MSNGRTDKRNGEFLFHLELAGSTYALESLSSTKNQAREPKQRRIGKREPTGIVTYEALPKPH